MAAARPARPAPMTRTRGFGVVLDWDWDLGGVRFGYCRDDWGLNLKRRRVGFEEQGRGRVRSFIGEGRRMRFVWLMGNFDLVHAN